MAAAVPLALCVPTYQERNDGDPMILKTKPCTRDWIIPASCVWIDTLQNSCIAPLGLMPVDMSTEKLPCRGKATLG